MLQTGGMAFLVFFSIIRHGTLAFDDFVFTFAIASSVSLHFYAFLLLFPFLVRLKDFGQKHWAVAPDLIMGMASWFRRLPTYAETKRSWTTGTDEWRVLVVFLF